MNNLPYASKTVSIAGAVANSSAILTSTATTTSPQTIPATYSSVLPRQVTVTTSAHTGTYVVASHIVVTGTDSNGQPLTETLALTAANGGETVLGSKAFATVTSVQFASQVDTSGAFTVGVQDAFVPFQVAQVRVGTPGSGTKTLKMGYADGSTDSITGINSGESFPTAPTRIYGDSTTTVQDITLYPWLPSPS